MNLPVFRMMTSMYTGAISSVINLPAFPPRMRESDYGCAHTEYHYPSVSANRACVAKLTEEYGTVGNLNINYAPKSALTLQRELLHTRFE